MAPTCRRRPTKSSGRSPGYTLIELVIAMMLTAIMVVSVFSVALTAKTGGGRNDRRMVAGTANKQLSAQLRNFVTGDTSANSQAVINGPGGKTGGWSMTSNSCVAASCVPCAALCDNCPGGGGNGCYALKPGSHTLKNYLPSWFEAAPYNGQATYFVVSGATVPSVSITTTWSEP